MLFAGTSPGKTLLFAADGKGMTKGRDSPPVKALAGETWSLPQEEWRR